MAFKNLRKKEKKSFLWMHESGRRPSEPQSQLFTASKVRRQPGKRESIGKKVLGKMKAERNAHGEERRNCFFPGLEKGKKSERFCRVGPPQLKVGGEVKKRVAGEKGSGRSSEGDGLWEASPASYEKTPSLISTTTKAREERGKTLFFCNAKAIGRIRRGRGSKYGRERLFSTR